MDVITAYDLYKQYNNQHALCGLNLQIPAGSAAVCVGGPASGKTTLIRLLAGLCRPTAGECSVMGLSPAFEMGKLHKVMGTVLETARLYKDLTLLENLRFFAEIHDVEENDGLDRASFLLHKLDIWEGRDVKVNDLPTDVVNRACLARALIHRPQVLLMDEFSDGLDRESLERVRELLSYLLTEEGVTLFLATKDTEYAEAIGSFFAFLDKGVLIAKGDWESLRRGAGVHFRAALKVTEEDKLPAGFKLLDGMWQKEIGSESEMPAIISKTVQDGGKLYEAKVIQPTLKEIFEAWLNGGAISQEEGGEPDEQSEEFCTESDSGTEEEGSLPKQYDDADPVQNQGEP